MLIEGENRTYDSYRNCWEYRDENNIYHRENDLPAIVCKDGKREWWWRGERHRKGDKPAYINPKTDEIAYYKFGKLHRDGGPAEITKRREIWYQHGLKHRDDGPAQITIISISALDFMYGNYAVKTVGDDKLCKKWYHMGKLIKKEGC